MTSKAQEVLERYKKFYVTDEQLKSYLNLGAISQSEYNTIYATRHPEETSEGTE